MSEQWPDWPHDEVVALRERVAQLEKNVREDSVMHRRAQAYEGAAIRLHRVRAGFGLQLDRVRRNYIRKMLVWKDRYRDAVKQLIAAGVSDHVDGKPYPQYRHGHLDVLIDRAVQSRDAEKQRANLAERATVEAIAAWLEEAGTDESVGYASDLLSGAWQEGVAQSGSKG